MADKITTSDNNGTAHVRDEDSDWDHVVEPVSVQQPQSCALDHDWIASIFPRKSSERLAEWLAVLHGSGFDDVGDLESFLAATATSNGSLDDLQGLPLAARNAIVEDIHRRTADSDSSPSLPRPPPTTTTSSSSDDVVNLPPPLTQLDVVVMDVSKSMKATSSMKTQNHEGRAGEDMTREDVSKMLFHTLLDKATGFEFSHAVGLIAFGERVDPVQCTDSGALTRDFERFHDQLGRLDADQYRTKLYDAIFEAAQMLDSYRTENADRLHSECKLRVFALTDGLDNASTHAPWTVAQYMQQRGIVLDAIPVAGHNQRLAALSKSTGGLCFAVRELDQAMGLFENEAVLSLRHREEDTAGAANVVIDSMATFAQIERSVIAPVQQVAAVSVSSANLQAATLTSPAQVEAAAAAAASSSSSSSTGTRKSGSGGALKRVLKEFRDFSSQSVEGWACYPQANNLMSWKAVLAGPTGSPYEGGNWLCHIEFPEEYPFRPPRFRFVTPIFHCNINTNGHVCLDILRDAWNPALSVGRVLQSVSSLLMQPNFYDPLDAFKGQLCRDDRAQYDAQAAEATRIQAGATAEEIAQRYNLA